MRKNRVGRGPLGKGTSRWARREVTMRNDLKVFASRAKLREAVKCLSLTKKRTFQALMVEAVKDLLAKHKTKSEPDMRLGAPHSADQQHQ
jgi:hypothetical protein